MRPLPDTPETAFEEVASALWPYARYSEKARLWCSFKAWTIAPDKTPFLETGL